MYVLACSVFISGAVTNKSWSIAQLAIIAFPVCRTKTFNNCPGDVQWEPRCRDTEIRAHVSCLLSLWVPFSLILLLPCCFYLTFAYMHAGYIDHIHPRFFYPLHTLLPPPLSSTLFSPLICLLFYFQLTF